MRIQIGSEAQATNNLRILNTQNGQVHVQIVELGLRRTSDFVLSDERRSIGRHLYPIVSPKRHPKVEISSSTPHSILIQYFFDCGNVCIHMRFLDMPSKTIFEQSAR